MPNISANYFLTLGEVGEDSDDPSNVEHGSTRNDPDGCGNFTNVEGQLAHGARQLQLSHSPTLSLELQSRHASEAYRHFTSARLAAQLLRHPKSTHALAHAAEALMRGAHIRVLQRLYPRVFGRFYEPAVSLLNDAREEADSAFAANFIDNSVEDPIGLAITMVIDEATAQGSALERRIAQLEAELDQLMASRDLARVALGERRWRRGDPNSSIARRRAQLVAELTAAKHLYDEEQAIETRLYGGA